MADAASHRLHALDNLRALMMWLGIVLHVAAIHLVGPSPLPWRDGSRSAGADVLVAFIHAFRMPVFFILAGFFAALLVRRDGVGGMLRNRLRRLALPFVIFWPVLWILVGAAALLFLHRMARGTWGWDPGVLPPDAPRGPNTMHLWFLWLLAWFAVLLAIVLRLRAKLPAWLFGRGRALLRALATRAWGFALLALPLAAIGALYPGGFLVVAGSFLPPWPEWLHHGLFFVFGLMLFADQQPLFALLQRRWAWHAAGGLLFFLATGLLVQGGSGAFATAYAYNCATWLWSLAWIGLALRALEHRNALLGWLAESAYWVYLLHFPLTVLWGAALFGFDWPAWSKIAVNVAATTAVCLATYHWWVRGGWIGQLLNGRRHPRAGVPATVS